jgi:hypothetical protein
MQEVTLALGSGRRRFSLTLNRKSLRLGQVTFEQWWLPIPSLYGERVGRRTALPGSNSVAIITGFWHLCREHSTHTDRDVQESVLLAHLVSGMRSGGSRRVLADGFLGPQGKKAAGADPTTLDGLIRGVRHQPYSRAQFRRDTVGALRTPGVVTDDARTEYRRLCDELFPTAVARLTRGISGAARSVTEVWNRWNVAVGRRRGNAAGKQAMDMLSYEARAAFHRVYSAVWVYLILPTLRAEHGLGAEAADFHEFWHTDPSWEVPDADANEHLFHGHVFGLHPAGALFLRVPAGRQVVGERLSLRRHINADRGSDGRLWSAIPDLPGGETPPTDSEAIAFGRVLSGYAAAVFHYAQQRSEISDARRPAIRAPGPDRRRKSNSAMKDR